MCQYFTIKMFEKEKKKHLCVRKSNSKMYLSHTTFKTLGYQKIIKDSSEIKYMYDIYVSILLFVIFASYYRQ